MEEDEAVPAGGRAVRCGSGMRTQGGVVKVRTRPAVAHPLGVRTVSFTR